MWGRGTNAVVCMWVSTYPALFVKDYSLPFGLSWSFCWKSSVHKCESLLDTWFYSTDLCIYPMPVPHCYAYCSFIGRCEIGKCEPIDFVILFQDCYSYCRFPAFMNFRISLWISVRKVSWKFGKDYIESVDQFGNFCHLIDIESSDAWT